MLETLKRLFSLLKTVFKVLGAGAVAWLLKQYIRHRLLLAKFLRRNPQYKEQVEQLGPFGGFLLHVKNYKRLYDLKIEYTEKYGPNPLYVQPFWEPGVALLSSDPETIKHGLQTNFNNYIKGTKFVSTLRPLLGDGIFVANHGPNADDKGASWYFQRKTASKMFTRNVFNSTQKIFSKNALKITAILDKSEGKTPVEMQELIFKFTLDTIGSIGFGVDLETLDHREKTDFAHAFDRAQSLSNKRFLLPFVELIGPVYETERELRRHIATMDKFSYDVIEKRLEDKEINGKFDILSHFICSMRESGDLPANAKDTKRKDLVYLRDIVLSFFIAGRDTTAALISFTLLLLCMHPESQEKLKDEIEKELGDQKEAPTLAQLNAGFPYLNGVIQETLRLYPSVPSDGKVSVEEDVLPNGIWLPPKSRINFEPYVMGRSTKIWGDISYKPERWMGPDAVSVTEFEMPTFQPGPRQCLGILLAPFEAKVLIVELVRRFQFKLARPLMKPEYVPGLTITVNGGLPVFATAR